MTVELPSNVIPLYQGSISITVYAGALWVDALPAKGVDQVASSLAFCDLWAQEVKRRHKRSYVYMKCLSGQQPALVDVSPGHDNVDAVMRDVLRLGQEVYGRRQDWTIFLGTPAANKIREKFDHTEQDDEPDTDF